MKKLGVLLIVIAMLALAAAIPTVAQDDSGFRPTFELQGPATEGALAGIDPSGQTVTFWHQHSGSREERLNELIAGFNTDNPWDITIEASNQGGYGDIYDKVIAGLTTGELPTLVVGYQNQTNAYLLGGGLFDMNAVVEDATWGLNEDEKADFIPAFYSQDIDPSTGVRIGFPPNRSLEALYYNATALAELGYDGPPTTWDEFHEMACRFTEEGWSGYEGDDAVGYSIRTDASNVAAMTYALGGDIWDPATQTYAYNNPQTVEALSFMQNLLNEGCANLIAESFADQNDFAAGKNLFYVGSTSGLPFVLSAVNESGAAFDWTVAYLPYSDQPVVDIYGASVSILAGPNTTIEQQLAAWLFIRWFSEPAQQVAWAEASQYFPVLISVSDQLGNVFAEIPQYEDAWNLLLNAQGAFEPPTASYDLVRREAQAAFNQILLEGADVETTLEALDARAVELQAEFAPQ